MSEVYMSSWKGGGIKRDSLTIHRTGGPQTDANGDYVRDANGDITYSPDTQTPATGFLRPLSAREATVGQQTGIISAEAQIERVQDATGWRKAREDDVGFEDQVVADGKTYSVAGRFFRRSATGRLDYLHCDLSLTE